MSKHAGVVRLNPGGDIQVVTEISGGVYRAVASCGGKSHTFEGPTNGAGVREIATAVAKNFATRSNPASVTPAKARQILHDTAGGKPFARTGKPITEKQRKYFGALVSRKENHWLLPLAVGLPAGAAFGAGAMHVAHKRGIMRSNPKSHVYKGHAVIWDGFKYGVPSLGDQVPTTSWSQPSFPRFSSLHKAKDFIDRMEGQKRSNPSKKDYELVARLLKDQARSSARPLPGDEGFKISGRKHKEALREAREGRFFGPPRLVCTACRGSGCRACSPHLFNPADSRAHRAGQATARAAKATGRAAKSAARATSTALSEFWGGLRASNPRGSAHIIEIQPTGDPYGKGCYDRELGSDKRGLPRLRHNGPCARCHGTCQVKLGKNLVACPLCCRRNPGDQSGARTGPGSRSDGQDMGGMRLNPLDAREAKAILDSAGQDLYAAGRFYKKSHGQTFFAGQASGKARVAQGYGPASMRDEAASMVIDAPKDNPFGCRRCNGVQQVKLGPRMVPCPTCRRKKGR